MHLAKSGESVIIAENDNIVVKTRNTDIIFVFLKYNIFFYSLHLSHTFYYSKCKPLFFNYALIAVVIIHYSTWVYRQYLSFSEYYTTSYIFNITVKSVCI